MKKRLITLTVLLFLSAAPSFGQTFTVSGAVFTYDNVGNRIIREIQTICIGCPKPAPQDSTKDAPPKLDDIKAKIFVEAYPNPTESDLFINNRNWKETDIADVVVFDISGKTVIKKRATQAKFSIPLIDLVPGTYMVQYYLNEAPTQVWRIVKM